jgi:hypothetical protein
MGNIFSKLIFSKHFKKISEMKARYNAPIKSKKEVIHMRNTDQEYLVQKIRTQYTEKQHTELNALKELDAKVKRPANVFAYTYGSVSAVVMGAGMSLVMTEIGAMIGLTATMAPGIAIGVVGLGMALSTYPIYKKILNSRKKTFAPQIMELSEKLMQK